MVSYNNNNDIFGEDTQAQWDLRQFRTKLIAKHLMEIDDSSRERNFAEWARNIRLLFKTVEHYVSTQVKDFEDGFNKLMKELSEISYKYKDTFLNKNNKADAIWEIEECLIKIERFIYWGMEESGLWGTKKDDTKGL